MGEMALVEAKRGSCQSRFGGPRTRMVVLRPLWVEMNCEEGDRERTVVTFVNERKSEIEEIKVEGRYRVV